MIKVGSDLVRVDRIEKLITQEKFVQKIFSEQEIAYLKSRKMRAETAAGIFAGKEAVSKVFGTGVAGFGWKEIEITPNEKGSPVVKLHGRADQIAKTLRIDQVSVSITHVEEYAMAIAVALNGHDDQLKDDIELKKREKDTHKGDYGRVGIVGGKRGMSGSIYLSCIAALRSGSGLVYALVPEKIFNTLSIKLTEVILEEISFKGDHLIMDDFYSIQNKWDKYDALCMGMGMGIEKDTQQLIQKIVKTWEKPLLIDADGLNALSGQLSLLSHRKACTIITPHEMEMARILKTQVEEIKNNRVQVAEQFAKKYGVITVLKGNKTIITDGRRTHINTSGNPGMATAGSGDVLSGIIISLVGQGHQAFEASRIGVYLHGLAGDEAAKKTGEYSLIASDILEALPSVMRDRIKKG